MRVLVFEYLTGGGCGESAMLAKLAAEGDVMLLAVVRDLLEVEGVEVLVLRDRRLPWPRQDVEIHWVDDDWQSAWAWALGCCDAVLPIAPETDGILERLCAGVEARGRYLLNSSAAAVGLAADKQATLDRLAQSGIPVVPSWRAGERSSWPADELLVVKPDMGAGCQDIRLMRHPAALAEFLAAQAAPERWLVQPYVDGRAASLSLLVGADGACLLGCNVQCVAQVDDGFVLLGCAVNGLTEGQEDFRALAQAICLAIPGLWGYVGVDFVLTDQGPVVLEVNPRLTTSYAGLSHSTSTNIAGLLIGLARGGGALPPVSLCRQCIHVDLELGRVA